jgi:hypothetical protein
MRTQTRFHAHEYLKGSQGSDPEDDRSSDRNM